MQLISGYCFSNCRYTVVCHDVKYDKTKLTLFLLILPSIIFSIYRTLVVPLLLGISNSCLHPRYNFSTNASYESKRDSFALNILNIVNTIDICAMLICPAILLVMNIRIYLKIKNSSMEINSFRAMDAVRINRNRNLSLMNRDVITSLSCFMHLFVFVIIYSTIIFYTRFGTLDCVYDLNYHTIVLSVQAMLALADPLIYVIFSKQFRRSIRNTFIYKLHFKRTSSERTVSSEPTPAVTNI